MFYSYLWIIDVLVFFQAILQTSSSLKRSDEELALADTQASIQSNIVSHFSMRPVMFPNIHVRYPQSLPISKML